MKKLANIFAVAAMLLTPFSAKADNEFSSTAMYYSLQGGGALSLYWDGFIVGAINAYQDNHEMCIDSHMTIGQDVQIVLNYMAQNPTVWGARPEAIVEAAMALTFPCKAH
ncbi:MAG: Rap1a/Tai family immunity protein [Pseudomonadota bacterium]